MLLSILSLPCILTLLVALQRALGCEALAVSVVMAPSLEFPAQALAESLKLPMMSTKAENAYDLCLSLEPYEFDNVGTYALAISQAVSKKKRTKPFWIDFAPSKSSSLARRLEQQDLLTKAVLPATTIVDATAGYGQDSWLLASRSTAYVTMVERHPIIAAMLRDAVRRLTLAGDPLGERLSLVETDAVEYLSTTTPDTVYLDPMFPPRRKSAAVKKNMQILHKLLSSSDHKNESNKSLLQAALDAAQCKVVVKRPVHAETLDGGMNAPVAYSIVGNINRWDVYNTNVP